MGLERKGYDERGLSLQLRQCPLLSRQKLCCRARTLAPLNLGRKSFHLGAPIATKFIKPCLHVLEACWINRIAPSCTLSAHLCKSGIAQNTKACETADCEMPNSASMTSTIFPDACCFWAISSSVRHPTGSDRTSKACITLLRCRNLRCERRFPARSSCGCHLQCRPPPSLGPRTQHSLPNSSSAHAWPASITCRPFV
ncbi:hypothetical protein PhaeoP78_00351 [Phaeobacter inhibens]|nr:hypothetical protein PhaeoP78_00351 [Phaeobacter inhibens]